MTDPLVSPEVDCTDLDCFMLNVEKLMASELVALSSHEVVGAALFLWCRAWKQKPTASLPDDDRVNAAFARLPVARFKKLKAEIMRGFVKCDDGRLYHRTLAVEAVAAYARKTAFRDKREKEAERLRKWRLAQGETRLETPTETHGETRFVPEGQGRDREGTVREEKKEAPTELPKKTPQRGTRLPPDWKPSGDFDAGLHGAELLTELAKFHDYWTAKAGSGGVKLDWEATWRNWLRNAADRQRGAPPRAAPRQNDFLNAAITSQADENRQRLAELDPADLYARFAAPKP